MSCLAFLSWIRGRLIRPLVPPYSSRLPTRFHQSLSRPANSTTNPGCRKVTSPVSGSRKANTEGSYLSSFMQDSGIVSPIFVVPKSWWQVINLRLLTTSIPIGSDAFVIMRFVFSSRLRRPLDVGSMGIITSCDEKVCDSGERITGSDKGVSEACKRETLSILLRERSPFLCSKLYGKRLFPCLPLYLEAELPPKNEV